MVKNQRLTRWKLIGDNEKIFTKKLNEIEELNVDGNINAMWNKIKEGVKRIAMGVVEESRDSMLEGK